jgi:hypothetical protein
LTRITSLNKKIIVHGGICILELNRGVAIAADLDARNHEITILKIKNVKLKESYAEGEITYN